MNADERGWSQIKWDYPIPVHRSDSTDKNGKALTTPRRKPRIFRDRSNARGVKHIATVSAIFLLLAITTRTRANDINRYAPLRVAALDAGVVAIRGNNVQGVDWPAPGVATVRVPLLVYRIPFGQLTANGQPIDTSLASDPSVEPLTPADPPLPVFDEDVYQQADAWTPGRSPAVRRWVLAAVGVIVLTLGVARHADPKRATMWLAIAGVGLAGGVVWLFPADTPRRTLPAAGRPGWEWVWIAGHRTTVREPWSPGLRYVPRSEWDLLIASPVLECDAAGKPVAIRARVFANGRAVFLRRQVN